MVKRGWRSAISRKPSAVSGQSSPAARPGFSLPELFLAVTIFALLAAYVFANFDRGKKANDLRQGALLLAQDLRQMQANAIAGQTIGGNVPKGFGLHVSDVSPNNTTYTLFADTDGCLRYDAGEELVSGVRAFPERVRINDLSTDLGSPMTVMDVVFTPPHAVAHLNASCTGGVPSSTDNVLTIVLLHDETGASRTVSANRVSGQISVQ